MMIDTRSAPTVFISYSHLDKRVARRVVRQLTARGVKVWLDERELRVPATLTKLIRDKIQGADALLVIASRASADSKWVKQEIDFAEQHGRGVIPLFIETLAKHPRFQDYLGIDGVRPQEFADAVHCLLLQLFDRDVPAADPEVLTAGLRELAEEEPNLAPLILGCLDSEGLHENMDMVYKVAFHALDYAVNALFELTRDRDIAERAADIFRKAGAGARALSSWIAATGDGGWELTLAVGTRNLEPTLIPTAIKLLSNCNPPNNLALYNFIEQNAEQLDDAQRRSVVLLVTYPERDTGRLGDVLGWWALKKLPDAIDIQNMWTRWVRDGAFDGEPCRPFSLAYWLTLAHNEGLPGWEAVNEALRTHVHELLRSCDKVKVELATDHIKAVADADNRAPILRALLGVAASARLGRDWREWEKRERDEAEWWDLYVSEVENEAEEDRDWRRARHTAEDTQRALKKDRQKRGDG
jgi:TIR domain